MSIEQDKLKNIIEAALLAVAKPMSVEQILKLFSDEDRPSANAIKEMLRMLQNDCDNRGIELKQVASGYRYQARSEYSEWLSRLWEEKPAKYSRAALETLALIAYRQPVTRAEIEDVRGVGVSSSIIKTMMEREWVRVVGHRDVPGRPALYATTKQFLDYFNMKSLQELPTLAEIKDLDELHPELDLPEPDQDPTQGQFDPDTLKEDNNYPLQLAGAEEADDSTDTNSETEAGKKFRNRKYQ
ncbi:MAG: SMC-Scp complex subunit ScpB [Enterobacterales bacterium]|nr:SMC-Scp complex subunit ScpB [Enterobacterales bacterium]